MILNRYNRISILCLFFALIAPSSANIANAASTAAGTVCTDCHSGLEGNLQEPVELWQLSVHAENNISCHDCHGGDPTDYEMAMSAERGFIGVPPKETIPNFCGRCHIGVKDDYLESAHGMALDNGGPQCVTCHGNHSVKKATPDLINEKDCSRCHEYDRAAEIKAAVIEIDRRFTILESALYSLKYENIATDKEEKRLFALKNAFHKIFHSVDVDLVREKTAFFSSEMDEIDKWQLDIRDQFSTRKKVGVVITALFVILGLLTLMIRRTYKEEEDAGEKPEKEIDRDQKD